VLYEGMTGATSICPPAKRGCRSGAANTRRIDHRGGRAIDVVPVFYAKGSMIGALL
jgi:hypothetical protein